MKTKKLLLLLFLAAGLLPPGCGRKQEPVKDGTIRSESAIGCYLGNRQRLYEAGTDQLVRSEENGAVTFVLMDPEALEEVKVSGYSAGLAQGASAKIIVVWTRAGEELLSKQYSMSVLKRDGGLVWLGSDDGRGFIFPE